MISDSSHNLEHIFSLRHDIGSLHWCHHDPAGIKGPLYVCSNVGDKCSKGVILPVQFSNNLTLHMDSVGWSCVLNCFMLHPYLVSMLFPDLLSLYPVFYSC